MTAYDVIVVGLGGVGSSAAFHLASAGHRVLGIDQHPPAHDRGSSHGKTRAIRMAYFEHPDYVPLLKRAYQLWDALDAASEPTLFHRTGVVEVGPADGVVVPGVLRSAREHRLDVEQLSARELHHRWAGLRGEDRWIAVLEPNAGFLRVENCVRRQLELAKAAGAELLHETTVIAWTNDGSGVRVSTEHGEHRAAKVVIAGGPWSGTLASQCGLPLKVLRKHQYWYRPQSHGYDLNDDFPCFFHETPAGCFYGFPSMNGTGLKVARHSGGTVIDGPTETHSCDKQDRQLNEDYLRAFLPGVGNELVDQKGCYYTCTPDEHFVVDTLPGNDRVTLIAGLSGHGFKFTSVLGELASQLATGVTPKLTIDLFGIQRFIGTA